MMDTTGLRLSLGFVLRHCMNITWTSVQSLWRQPLQASAILILVEEVEQC